MPRFGKDKDARKEELDRQAAEEVERLTRRSGPAGMGGGMPGMPGGPHIGMPSPLEMMAAELADGPRPVQRRQQQGPRKAAARPQQAFTPMPSGEVGSSFGPGGLNPGPRMAGGAPPPPSFGAEDYGGHVTGPPVYNAGEYDEDEEMSITELALMDHAAHTGHWPEDLVMQYDAGSAEEMRDAAMRQFYERQQARRPGAGSSDPFAPAGMRRGPSGGGGAGGGRRGDDPVVAGGALAQRLANRRRREEEEARRARVADEPAPARAPAARAGQDEAAVDEGALSRVLARRRQALGVDNQPEPAVAPGSRHSTSRAESSPGLRAVPSHDLEDDEDDEDDVAVAPPARPARKAPAAKSTTAARAAKQPAAKQPAAKPVKPPATKAPAAKATKAPAKKAAARKAPAAKPPAAKAPAGKPARTAGKASTVFCMECGEKNPAIAKFCFNCGNRLAVPET